MDSMDDNNPPDETIRIHYIKSPGFRTIHVDGVYVGPTPSNKVAVSFFSERFPIPQETIHTVEEGFEIGGEVDRTSREGLVRELEVNMVMDAEIAERIALFIQQQVARVRDLRGQAQ